MKLFVSNHKISVKTGRHRKFVLPYEERVCDCTNKESEDEMLAFCTLHYVNISYKIATHSIATMIC